MTPIEMARTIHGNEMPSHVLIALAVLMDNASIDTFSTREMENWLAMADNISGMIPNSGEARFSLYDYLDACINSPGHDWNATKRGLEEALESNDPVRIDAAFQTLINMTAKKRNTYEGRF